MKLDQILGEKGMTEVTDAMSVILMSNGPFASLMLKSAAAVECEAGSDHIPIHLTREEAFVLVSCMTVASKYRKAVVKELEERKT
jgi:hypothetical protein